MKKIKVMHILNTGGYSGAENVVITLINSMKDSVDGIYASPNGTISEVLKENEIKYCPVKGNAVTARELKRVIKEIRPDIIHAHDFTAGVMAARCAGKIPVINHLHNNSPWIKKMCLKSIIYGISCLRYKKILTVSDSVMDEYILGRFLERKTHVVGNPVDLQAIKDKSSQGECLGDYDIAFLGRFSLPKNPHFFIEIVDELRKKLPSLKAIMIGDGELHAEIETHIKSLGLEQTITLCGFQKNPYSILRHVKMLCMPSSWEGFGLAAVEAMALGKPVVASPVGGLANIVNNSCGYLCNEKSEFVNAMLELITDSIVYEQKCIGAIERANDFDNIQKYSNKMKSLYQAVS